MDRSWAEAFATQWARDWNAHDIDAVLAHFAEDVVFTSPVAARVVPDTGGVVRGKEALRAYWTLGLSKVPDLHFEVVSVFVGVDVLVIAYRNQRGDHVSEVLELADDLVVRGHGTYLAGGGATAARAG
ncbi:MAG: nuclear transport factor 2 family protein [Actinomycetota bacterium]|nr:nuclear transport factor 2 family protein [Actinomycetota bacterium]